MQSNLRAMLRRCPGTTAWGAASRNAASAGCVRQQKLQQQAQPRHLSSPGVELGFGFDPASQQCCPHRLASGLASGARPGSKSWRDSSSGRKVHAGVAAGFPLSSNGDDDTSPLKSDPLHDAAAAPGGSVGGLPDSASLYRKDLRK